MKRILYIAIAVLLVMGVFIVFVLANMSGSKQGQGTDSVEIFYGDSNQPAVTPAQTTDIWDYLNGQNTQPAAQETGVVTEVMTDANGAAVTDANGNPLYVVGGNTTETQTTGGDSTAAETSDTAPAETTAPPETTVGGLVTLFTTTAPQPQQTELTRMTLIIR